MERITIHIKPLDWSEGDVYGIRLTLTGEKPAVHIDWGDGTEKTYCGNEISEYHIYPKDINLSFTVVVRIISGSAVFVDPTGGDMAYELVDFSQAPSLKEIEAEMTQKVILDNPCLEKMTLRINLGESYDLSKCPNLRKLSFHCESRCDTLDLSNSHRLEWLSCSGYADPGLRTLTVADNAPLKYLEISGHQLPDTAIALLHAIIERNGGEINED